MPDDPNNNERKIVAAGEVAPFDQVSISHRDWLSDAQRKIDILHDQYWRDGNVLRAWRAIALAKRGGVARPEWALAYIDRVAQGIYALLDDVLLQESRRSKKSRRSKVPPKHLSSRTLQALGFNKGRGHRSAFADWIARERDAEMVEHLMWLVFPWFTQEPAIEKLDHAYDVVAEQYGVDRSTVVRAAAQYLRDRQDFDGSVDHVSTMKQYVRRHKARRRQEIALFKKAVPGTHSSQSCQNVRQRPLSAPHLQETDAYMQLKTLDEDVLPRTYCEAAQDLPASTAADRALIALVRLLARQTVRDWLGQPETTEDSDTDAPCPSSAVSAGERR